jgi:hypothetical protein
MLRNTVADSKRKSYATELYAHASRVWTDFWFQESSTKTVSLVRIFAGFVIIAIGLDSIFSLPNWLSSTGLLDVSLTRDLIGVKKEWDSIFRPSLLYFLSTKLSIQLYFGALVGTAGLMALGIGSRWTVAVVYVLFLGICHRMPFLIGPAEYLMCAVLLYLVIDPGKALRPARYGLSDNTNRFSAHLALRLLQVHLWLWMLFALLSQLAAVIWWEGEAVWFLAAQHKAFLPTALLAKNAILVNFITHGLIFSQATALFCLSKKLTRPIGLAAAMIAWVGIGVVSGDVYYAAVGIVASLSYLDLYLDPVVQ